MILNNVEVKVLASIELIDAYNNKFPKNFINKNVIYCIHNNINGKNYVGQTVDFRKRFKKKVRGHFYDYEQFVEGKLRGTSAIYRAWRKYKFESFTVFIIDISKDKKGLNEKEVYWIKTLHTCTKDPECFGYNLTWGGSDVSDACKDSLKKSMETRKKKYGGYFVNHNSPETLAKIKKTKEERYGHSGFVNANTPEAIEKRRKTNLERYGSYGHPMSKETIELRKEQNIEKYGNSMGACLLPENKGKARKNLTIFMLFKSITTNLSNSNEKISSFDQYHEFIVSTYRGFSSTSHHVRQILKFLPELKKDNRWTPELDKIFEDLEKMSEGDLEQKIEKRLIKKKREAADKQRGVPKASGGCFVTKMFNSIDRIFKSSNNISNWEEYKKLVKTNFRNRASAKNHLKRLVELLPQLKQREEWTEEHERLFGHLDQKE